MIKIMLNGDGMVNLKTESFSQAETHAYRTFWFKIVDKKELESFLSENGVSLVDGTIVDDLDGYEYGIIQENV